MDLLLVEPPFFRLMGERKFWIPLGLMSVAKSARARGMTVGVFNGDATVDHESELILPYSQRFYRAKTEELLASSEFDRVMYEWTETLLTHSPRAVGVSVKSEVVPFAIEMIKRAVATVHNVKIIVGGPHFNSRERPEFTELVDSVCVGEGEGFATDILRLVSGQVPEHRVWSIAPGSPLPVIEESLDLELDLIVPSQQRGVEKLSKLMLASSRGCPFSCGFCQMGFDHGGVRYARGEAIANFMRRFLDERNISRYYFVDDTFGVSQSQLDEFEASLGELTGQVRWSCMSHTHVLRPSRIRQLKRLGCDVVHVGVESGSPRILRLMNKRVKPQELRECSDDIRGADIELRAFVMIGVPGETDEDLDLTRKLLASMDPGEIAAQVFVPYDGTMMTERLIAERVISRMSWTNYSRADLNYGIQGNASVVHPRIQEFFDFVDEWNSKR